MASVKLYYSKDRISDEMLKTIRVSVDYAVSRDYPSRNRIVSIKPKTGLPIDEVPMSASWLAGNDIIVEVHPSRPARSARRDPESQARGLASAIGVGFNIKHPDSGIRLAVRLVGRRSSECSALRAVEILHGTRDVPVS